MQWRHLIATFCAVVLLGVASVHAASTKLVVYTYDSFGPIKEIESGFEKKYGVDVVFVAPSSAGEMLARLIGEMETGGTSADVFIGLSDTQLSRAQSRNVFSTLDKSKIPNLSSVPAKLQFDAKGQVVPFDHGYITLVYNTKAIKPADLPKSFEDLTSPRFAKKIIAIDPRTSSPGHAFLMWTIEHFGEKGFANYWKRLAPNLLTIAGGWSAAYKMFENGDAPIVVSYATDTAFAVMEGKGPVYGVLPLEGAGYSQVEGVGIVRTSKNVDLAHAFINYLLSPEIQTLMPTTNYMYPANSKAKLPKEWEQYAKEPQKLVRIDADEVGSKEAGWLREWAMAVSM